MDAIFRLVFITTLYASAVGLVLLLLKTLLKDKLNPKWHYLLWIVLLVKLLVPFGPESAISLFNTVPPLPKAASINWAYEEYHKSTDYMRQQKPEIPTTRVIKESTLFVAAKAETAVPYIWLAGVVSMAGWLVFSNYSLKRKIQRSAVPVPPSVQQLYAECKRKIEVNKDIPIVMQNVVQTPALFGLLRPRILLSSTLSSLRDKEISYILLHELAHYKRKDLAVSHLLLLLQMIHWFNPVLWVCFKRIRQDMEMATDEQVLALLEKDEQKEYGKALLSVLENFNKPKLAPRLIGMVDDKKNIEERIKIIKRMGFFQRRSRLIITLGVLCVSILSGLLLTNGISRASSPEQNKVPEQKGLYDTAVLMGFKTPYVGNHVKVGSILYSLPYSYYAREGFSLQTKGRPYGVSIKYEMTDTGLSGEAIASTLRNNAAVLFALVDNVDQAMFTVVLPGEKEETHTFTREQLQKSYSRDLRDFGKNEAALTSLISGFSAGQEKDNPVIPAVKSLEEAISLAIKAQGRTFRYGEAICEGHDILQTKTSGNITTVYTLYAISLFCFTDEVFANVAGSETRPAILTLTKNRDGEYSLLDYKEPTQGSAYSDSVKELFPQGLWDKILHSESYPSFEREMKEQAGAYLKSIGRNATVSMAYLGRKALTINQEAFDRLFTGIATINPELYKFPNWAGSRELLEGGNRYVYSTSQGKTGDGLLLITFRKAREDGTVMTEINYQIVGNTPEPVP